MEHRAPLTPEAAVTISALTTPRPIADPAELALEDTTRLLVEADAVRRELDVTRRLLWVIVRRHYGGVRVSDAEVARAPGFGALTVEPMPGGLRLEARS